MARVSARAAPERERVVRTARQRCPACGERPRYRYDHRRTVATLTGLIGLHLTVRRCEGAACGRRGVPYRPEAEGALVLCRGTSSAST